jgi:biopolymer transport protein ExbD
MKLTSTIRLKPDFLYIAPLLNLVLLLLIFFLLNSSMVVRSGITVTLPESNSALQLMQDPDFVTLTIGKPGKILFNRDEQTTWENLGEKIRASTSKSRHVIINADPMVPHGEVIRAQNVILETGREVSIATKLPKLPTPSAK